VARYGGEEFVVLMPETNLEAAWQKVETVRELLADTPIALNSGNKIVGATISAGLACYPQDGIDQAELFAAADERMFQAKKEGRNRVVAGEEVVVS
jgi:diguanylate cyclase (GGDEF)-like protein